MLSDNLSSPVSFKYSSFSGPHRFRGFAGFVTYQVFEII